MILRSWCVFEIQVFEVQVFELQVFNGPMQNLTAI